MDLVESIRASLNRSFEALEMEIGDVITRDLFKARKSLNNCFIKSFELGDIFWCWKAESFCFVCKGNIVDIFEDSKGTRRLGFVYLDAFEDSDIFERADIVVKSNGIVGNGFDGMGRREEESTVMSRKGKRSIGIRDMEMKDFFEASELLEGSRTKF